MCEAGEVDAPEQLEVVEDILVTRSVTQAHVAAENQELASKAANCVSYPCVRIGNEYDIGTISHGLVKEVIKFGKWVSLEIVNAWTRMASLANALPRPEEKA